MRVFISGSIKIKKLDENVLEKINDIVNRSEYQVIVGDANGVDSSIQQYLNRVQSKSVVVYCAGDKPRNNIGSWDVKKIKVHARAGTREFYTAKDIEMAKDCDYGLMVWDAKSTGTLNNAIELLKRKKMAWVYLNKFGGGFLKIKEPSDLEKLISFMDEKDKNIAEEKLELTKKMESFRNHQVSLCDYA
jgi:hypothetical protein